MIVARQLHGLGGSGADAAAQWTVIGSVAFGIPAAIGAAVAWLLYSGAPKRKRRRAVIIGAVAPPLVLAMALFTAPLWDK